MTAHAMSSDRSLAALWDELATMANAQFASLPFRRLLQMEFNLERARQYSIQMAYYVKNRRDCWGYVQGSAPLPIKKMIWAHEQDELIGKASEGKLDHIALAVKEGEALGLTPEAFERAPCLEGASVCFSAWIRLAQRPWLAAIAGSAILEMRNSSEVIQGGSLSQRIGEKFARDLGIPLRQQVNNAEHVVMDREHGRLLMEVARAHAHTESAREAILEGAAESLLIDRVYRGHLADMLEAVP